MLILRRRALTEKNQKQPACGMKDKTEVSLAWSMLAAKGHWAGGCKSHLMILMIFCLL